MNFPTKSNMGKLLRQINLVHIRPETSPFKFMARFWNLPVESDTFKTENIQDTKSLNI